MPEPLVLHVYGRPNCHLCDVAKQALPTALTGRPVTIEERNVEDRPEWEAAFGAEIPVGILAGAKVFKYRVDVAKLQRAVDRRLRGPRS